MKNRIKVIILTAVMLTMAGCGKNEARLITDGNSAGVENGSQAEETGEEGSVAEEVDPCEVEGHKWIDATCTEAKTCSVCGKTEGEPLGHDWIESTPNYQQSKTCSRCGETEGEPLEAACAGLDFADLDKEYDMPMMLNKNPDTVNTAKVWFSNYKVFDSDEDHEAKEGYEWRSVDMYCAIGDDTEYKNLKYEIAWGVGDYYQDKDLNEDDTMTVNYLDNDYSDCLYKETKIKEEKNVKNTDYKKFGWSGKGTDTYIYNFAFRGPKGFDGFYVFYCDYDELMLNEGDLKKSKNVVYFRLDK